MRKLASTNVVRPRDRTMYVYVYVCVFSFAMISWAYCRPIGKLAAEEQLGTTDHVKVLLNVTVSHHMTFDVRFN